MSLLAAARRLIGHEIHRPGPAHGAPQCPSTQAVHRARADIYRSQHADMLEQFRAIRGRDLPAVERIIKGD